MAEIRIPGTWRALFRFELAKMAGRRITWVPFFAIAIVAVEYTFFDSFVDFAVSL